MSSSKQPLRSRFVRRAFPIGALLAAGCAASGVGDRAPVPALAESPEAQREFDELNLLWKEAAESERLALDSRLRAFLRRHGEDPVARRVRVYAAWNAVGRGELAGAERLLLPVVGGPPGMAQDEALVVASAIALQRGRAIRALELLEPLDGKLIDESTRARYSEQRALAALATRRWDLAVDTIEEWLVGVPASLRPTSEPRARALLGRLPLVQVGRQVERLNARINQPRASDPETVVTRWLGDTLRGRLVSSALARRDAKLAQRLLQDGPPQPQNAEGSALEELAGMAEVAPVVRGRTVGLVVYTDDSRRRRLSAAVSEGLVLALGLPRRGESPEAPRLLIREVSETEELLPALRGLAGDGAAILVAGVDARSADEALAYVESNSAPLLLLAAPTKPLPKGMPVFSLGLAPGAEERATNDVLSRLGTEQVAFVGLDGDCEAQSSASDGYLPIEDWKRNDVDAVAVLGTADCAKSLSRKLQGTGFHPTVVFGLEAANTFSRNAWPWRSVWLTVGHFPLSARDALPAELRGLRPDLGWYQSLGYDAGTIALSALHAVPTGSIEDEAQVDELHRRTAATIAEVEATLITTFAHGFDDGSVLSRELDTVARRQ